MKKFNNKFNKRMGMIGGFMSFMLVLFCTTLFAGQIHEIGEVVGAAFGASDHVIATISGGVQVTTSALIIMPILVDVDGNEFTIKTDEEIGKMEDEEKSKYVADLIKWQSKNMLRLQKELEEKGEKETEIVAKLHELRDNQLKTMTKALETQGIELEKLKQGALELPKTARMQVTKWLEDNHDELKKIEKTGAGLMELTIKAPADISTGSATNPDGIPELVGVQMAPPSNINLKDTIVESLVTTLITSLAAYPYTESVPKDGDYAFIGEGVLKPQIDFKIETRYAEPVKVAAHEILTTESVQDIPGLQSIANDFLRKKHALKKQNGILFGDGLGDNPKGATVYGRAFVAGAMALKVQDANIMDVINACITDVYTTHNYQDETPYMPNLVMMNPVDFFIELVSAKDGNGLPLFPTASLFNRVTIGGVTIIPFEDIPTDKIFVADMSKYNITNYVDYTVKIGWINDQFITNKFTMVGESRFHAFVKALDEQAFIYDNISTVKAAILKP